MARITKEEVLQVFQGENFRRAINSIADGFIDQLADFQEMERRMEAEAECIAGENRQRDWE